MKIVNRISYSIQTTNDLAIITRSLADAFAGNYTYISILGFNLNSLSNIILNTFPVCKHYSKVSI